MKKILVPVDFSTHTSVSSLYALQLAEVFGAEIILFHSFFDQFYYSDGGLSTGFESGLLLTDEIILDFYKQKENALQELAKNLNSIISKEKTGNIKISYRMESGNPEIQIINAINQLKPDMIVMGSGGMGKKALLSGSVARRIIDHTDIPVIAIPERKELPALRNIAYMTNYDPDDAGVICAIDDLLKPFNARFFCLHISKGEPDEEIRQKMITLSESIGLKSLEGRITFHMESDDSADQVLDNYMKVHKIGLIAFIPHKRNIFEDLFYQGITREDLFKTKIPVMAFRPAR